MSIKSDLIIEGHGSIALIRPMTVRAKVWLRDNVSVEGGWQWFGGALAAEPRYVEAVVAGAENDGLKVRW